MAGFLIGRVLGRVLGSDIRGGTAAGAHRPDPLKYEKAAGERLFALCREAVAEAARNPARPGAPADPRVGLHRQIMGELSAHGAPCLSDLPEAQVRLYGELAQTVLLRDEDFEIFADGLKPDARATANARRDAWFAELEAFAQADALDAEEDPELRELMTVWLAERDEDLEEGLLAWVQDGGPDRWHALAEGLDWPNRANGPEALDAVHWIVTQPRCDRATALTFLATMARFALYDQSHGYLDPARALEVMEEIHSRLIDRAYLHARYAVPPVWAGDVERLLNAIPGDDMRGRFALARQVVEPLGDAPGDSEYGFSEGAPYLKFEAWKAREGV